MSRVAITKCTSYQESRVEDAIEEALAASDFPEVGGKTVLLKPNILSDAPVTKSITTNPAILRAVIRILKKRNAKRILVGDSPGLHKPGFTPRASKVAEVVAEEHVEWVDFTESTKVEQIPFCDNISLPFSTVLDEVDLLITLPKCKTHKLMYVTGAVKNQFGLIPGLHKSPCHVKCPSREKFASLIVGINTLHRPDFAIMDAVIGMEGDGPANGNPRYLGLILASDDILALDWAQATVMGHEPMDIPIIREGLARSLGKKPVYPLLDAEKLEVKDFKRIEIQKKSNLITTLLIPFITRPFKNGARKAERPAPRFGHPDCILCGRCVAICPAGVLTLQKKSIHIDTSKCVRCYCCHEVCPVNAITIKEES